MDDYLAANDTCGHGFRGSYRLATGPDGRSPLGRSAELWTDDDLQEIGSIIAKCQKTARQNGVVLDLSSVSQDIIKMVEPAIANRQRKIQQEAAQNAIKAEELKQSLARSKAATVAAQEQTQALEAERVQAAELAKQESKRIEAEAENEKIRNDIQNIHTLATRPQAPNQVHDEPQIAAYQTSTGNCHQSGGSYTNSSGHVVSDPKCVTGHVQGETAICRDGSHSFSEHHRGTCSGHGGVAEWE